MKTQQQQQTTSLDKCLELDITRYKKTDVVKLDTLEFLLRTKGRICYVYELSTRRCILVSLRERNKILNFLLKRIEDVKEAVADFHDRAKAMQQTKSDIQGSVLQ
jgi:hypothetical protein